MNDIIHLVCLAEFLGGEEDVVDAVEDDGHRLLVLGRHQVAEGAQHARLEGRWRNMC